MKVNLIYKSCFSASFEIVNEDRYFNSFSFNVYLNDELVLEKINTNVFSLYNLKSDSLYFISFSDERLESFSFKTDRCDCLVDVDDFNVYKDGIHNDTLALQAAIYSCLDGGCVYIKKGIYLVDSLFIRSNVSIYLEKGVLIKGTNDRKAMFPPLLNDDTILGSFEGENEKIYTSLINIINQKNVNIFGEGIIDGNAISTTWWEEGKRKVRYRPKLIYICNSKDINLEGISVCNSPSWTIHPLRSDDINIIDLKIVNPKDSVNTDGCNPESCHRVNIIGTYFSVGDDCIAIKSGKLEVSKKYYRECKDINVRNCYMKDGHGALVIGSEMSCGVYNINVSKCIFDSTDRGLRIKTRRGRGSYAIIRNLVFENIYMKDVLNNFVINMYYFCDIDGKSPYVYRKDIYKVEEDIPYLENFHFRNIECKDTLVSAGFFYGLSERYIESIKLENITVSFKESLVYDYPAMMDFIDKVNRLGFYFNSINKVEINNVKVINQRGDQFIFENVHEIKGDI